MPEPGHGNWQHPREIKAEVLWRLGLERGKVMGERRGTKTQQRGNRQRAKGK